jgi:hypothetical protein
MKTKTIANVRIGKPDVKPTLPSHVWGVRQGNDGAGDDKQQGIVLLDNEARGTARRSTGINAKAHEPIDPRMPTLTPS